MEFKTNCNDLFRYMDFYRFDIKKTMVWLPKRCWDFIEQLISFRDTGIDIQSDLASQSSSDASEEEGEVDVASKQDDLAQLPRPSGSPSSSSAKYTRGKGLSHLGRKQSILAPPRDQPSSSSSIPHGKRKAASGSSTSVIKRPRVAPIKKPTKNPSRAERFAQAKMSYQQLYEKCLVTRPDNTYGEDTPDQDTFKIDINLIDQPPWNKLVRPPNKSYVKTLVKVMERRPYAAVAPLLLQVGMNFF